MDDDGMPVLRGRLTPEVGAVVQRALDAAADRLFREAPDRPAEQPVAEQTSQSQRRADALALLAECALAADLDRGTAGDRYQVVLHVEGDALRREAASAPAETQTTDTEQAVLDGGPYVSAETSRRLACDASLVVMRHALDGSVLDVGRKTRTIPSALRRALLARDGQCRFPCCTGRHTDAHHLEHWADGGPTCAKMARLIGVLGRERRVAPGADDRATGERGHRRRTLDELSPVVRREVRRGVRPRCTSAGGGTRAARSLRCCGHRYPHVVEAHTGRATCGASRYPVR